MAPSKLVAGTAIVAAALAVSFSAIFIRFTSDDLPGVTIAFYRLLFSVMMLLPVAVKLRWKELRHLARSDFVKGIVIGLVLALHFACFITAVKLTTIAAAVLLAVSHPLIVAPVAHVLFRERLNRTATLGITVAMGGVVVLLIGDLSGGQNTVIGNLLGWASGIFAGIYLLGGKGLRRRVTTLSYTAIVYTACMIFLFVFVLLLREPVRPGRDVIWADLGWCLMMAIFPMLLGHSIFNWVVGYVNARVVSVSILGEPVGAALLGLAFFGEVPTIPTILATPLIFLGIYLTSSETRSPPAESE